MTSRLLIALCCGGLIVGTCSAQQASVSPGPILDVIELHPDSTLQTLLPSVGGIYGPIRCDSKGNLYWQTEFGPLVRISADGQRSTTYDVQSYSKLRRIATAPGRLVDYTVTSDGTVYASVTIGKESYIVEFDSDGDGNSLTKIEGPDLLQPKGLAVFSDGSFLVAGVIRSEHAKFKPFTAIFDSNGRVVVRLTLRTDKKVVDQMSDITFRQESPIESGNVASASDGNVYVFRRLKKPVVHVLSSTGRLLRTFSIDPPEGFQAVSFRLSERRIIVTFQKGGREDFQILYGLYGVNEGEPLAFYKSSNQLQGILGCYADEQFTFLSFKDGKRTIVHARP